MYVPLNLPNKLLNVIKWGSFLLFRNSLVSHATFYIFQPFLWFQIVNVNIGKNAFDRLMQHIFMHILLLNFLLKQLTCKFYFNDFLAYSFFEKKGPETHICNSCSERSMEFVTDRPTDRPTNQPTKRPTGRQTGSWGLGKFHFQ